MTRNTESGYRVEEHCKHNHFKYIGTGEEQCEHCGFVRKRTGIMILTDEQKEKAEHLKKSLIVSDLALATFGR